MAIRSSTRGLRRARSAPVEGRAPRSSGGRAVDGGGAAHPLAPDTLRKVSFEIYRHLCKDDLLMRLPARLKGYASWLPSSWRILVIVDVDDDHCVELKRRLGPSPSTWSRNVIARGASGSCMLRCKR
ncbi:uncharacterized protein SOCEGT47_068330 [Sorangium cellulosum]|uniref:Uncharacterized protein n=1 Tax=Sorangium cellulosum TaxID=56 RepID=A0A4V0NEI3_SORCE|nr:uncharacterized protein SOCEGT47_068330 [Sorangium cellulosum]